MALLLFLRPSKHPKNLLVLKLSSGHVLLPPGIRLAPAGLGEMSPALSFALTCS